MSRSGARIRINDDSFIPEKCGSKTSSTTRRQSWQSLHLALNSLEEPRHSPALIFSSERVRHREHSVASLAWAILSCSAERYLQSLRMTIEIAIALTCSDQRTCLDCEPAWSEVGEWSSIERRALALKAMGRRVFRQISPLRSSISPTRLSAIPTISRAPISRLIL
jgi:hypothetical protein